MIEFETWLLYCVNATKTIELTKIKITSLDYSRMKPSECLHISNSHEQCMCALCHIPTKFVVGVETSILMSFYPSLLLSN